MNYTNEEDAWLNKPKEQIPQWRINFKSMVGMEMSSTPRKEWIDSFTVNRQPPYWLGSNSNFDY